MFTVYKITWDTGEFYFGLTGRTTDERIEEHRNDSQGNSKVYRLFQKRTNFRVIDLKVNLYENQAQFFERQYINLYMKNPNCINKQ